MTTFTTLLLALTAAAPMVGDIPEPNPSEMTRAEINAFNAKLDRSHPYYIKCEKAPATGSLVPRKSVCKTNERWAVLGRGTSDQVREAVTPAGTGSQSGN